MNTVQGLGRRLLAVAFLCLAPFPALPQDHSPNQNSGTSATAGPAAQSCILLEDVATGSSRYRTDFPVLWPQQLTGLDLAASFTLAQKDPQPVRLAVEDYYSMKLGKQVSFPQNRYNPKLNETADRAANPDFGDQAALLLAKPPYGTSATGFLDFVSYSGAKDQKETYDPPAIYIADDLDIERYRFASSFGKAPFTIVASPYTSSEDLAKIVHDVTFVEPLEWGGHPERSGLPKDRTPHLYVPDDSTAVRGELAAPELSHFPESGNAPIFLGAAVSNALSLAPHLSNAALRDWLRLTANRENRAFAATGIPALNAYRFIRTVARIRDACLGKEFTTCEAAIRADERKRAALVDFQDEALEKFNGAMLTLKNATVGCDEKVAAMKALRQATLLDPANRKYRAALAEYYAAEKFHQAADFVRFGKDLDHLLEQTERWGKLGIAEQTWERRALRRSGINVGEALTKGLNSPNPDAREGAVIASASLPDKAAIDFLKEVARRKDWRALSRGISYVIHSDTREAVKPKAKLPHYVPLIKAAVADLHLQKEPSTDLIFLYGSVGNLIKEADFDLEKVRHLIDYLVEESLIGRRAESDIASRTLADLGYYDQTKFENKYLVRAWLHVVRKSNDIGVIDNIVDELGKDAERRQALLTLLDDRKAAVVGLPELVERLRKDGWAQ